MIDKIKIYLIADLSAKTERNFFERLEFYLESGIRLFQFRAKDSSEDTLRFYIERLKLLSEKYNSLFIINDYWYFVNEFELDGVHLGRDDFPPDIFKKIVAPDKIVGYTVNYLEDLDFANTFHSDYVGIGPVFPTKTKAKNKLAPILGPDGIKKIASKTLVPYFAIGGINGENIPLLLENGIERFALSSYLMQNPDPKKVVKFFKKLSLI